MRAMMTKEDNELYDRLWNSGFLDRLPKQKICKLQRALTVERKKRYSRSRARKYGNLPRNFTDAEKQRLIECTKSPKARMVFVLMENSGLRIGEAVKVNYEDIDWDEGLLRLESEKTGMIDVVPLHAGILGQLWRWCQSQNIREGPVFRARWPNDNSPYLSKDWLRGEFRAARKAAGIGLVYAKSTNGRALDRLTSHSFRHTFITKVYNATKDAKLAQRLARHTNPKTTDTYIHVTQERLVEAVAEAFK